jgi:tetratricopeptide (TPR) repeat protein
MPTSAVRPSLAVGQLFRERRAASNLTLAEVSRRLAANGSPIPHSTLVRIEQGKLDPGVRRLSHLLDFYEIAPHVVADLVALEDMSADQEVKSHESPKRLYQKGIALWQAGDLKAALAHFFVLRGSRGTTKVDKELRRKAALGLAIAARDLGKLRLAKTLLDDVFLDSPPHEELSKALVVAASVWQRLGSDVVAFALLREVKRSAPPREGELAAFIAHQEARLLLAAGRAREARSALGRAISEYKRGKDTYGETRAALLATRIQEAIGTTARALASSLAAMALARKNGHDKLLVSAQLEHGRLLIGTKRFRDAEPILRDALSQAIRLQDRAARFLAHYHLWKVYDGLQDAAHAHIEWNGARSLVRHMDETSPEAMEIRRLKAKGG